MVAKLVLNCALRDKEVEIFLKTNNRRAEISREMNEDWKTEIIRCLRTSTMVCLSTLLDGFEERWRWRK